MGVARPPTVRPLTGLRFAAAFHVVLHHYVRGPLLEDVPAPLRPLAENGFVGVSVFFVLSGFILAYVYGPELAERGGIDRRRFWLHRFARVYPVYGLALLLALPGVLGHALQEGWSAARFLVTGALAAGLLQAWSPAHATEWNGPGWSLSVEALFYVLFPFLLPAIVRATARLRTGGLLAALLATWVLCVVPVLLVRQWLVPEGPFSGVLPFPLLHVPQFTVGVLAALLRARWADPGPRASSALLATAAAGLLACLLLPGGGPWTHVLYTGLLAPAVAAAILALSWTLGGLGSAVGHPVAVALGEASYALYILDAPFRWFYGSACVAAFGTGYQGHWGLTLLGMAGTVALALAINRWFERPAREWIMGRAQRA